MRNYASPEDGRDPTGFGYDYDYCYDVPARTKKDIPARWYIKVERDPQIAAHRDERQNAAILELLKWAHENREQLGLPDAAHGEQQPANATDAPAAGRDT